METFEEQVLNTLQQILKELQNINLQTTADTTINVSTKVENVNEFMKSINDKLRARGNKF